MSAFVIRSSDLDRCPIRSLLASHWRADGSCLCREARLSTAAEGESGAVRPGEGRLGRCGVCEKDDQPIAEWDVGGDPPFFPSEPFNVCVASPATAGSERAR